MSRYDDIYATPQDERADELQDQLQALPAFRLDALASSEDEHLDRLVSATEPGSLWLAMETIVARNVERSVSHRMQAAPRATRCDALEALIREFTIFPAPPTSDRASVGGAFSSLSEAAA